MASFSSKNNLQNLIWLNLSMVFVGTSGPLGRFIDMPVPVIIAQRALLAGTLLYIFCKWKNIELSVKKQDRKTILLGGVLLGLHWLTYFYALKLSNVAIGMLSMFTYPIITSLLEPLILKTKFQFIHLFLGALVLVGIYFLVPEFSLENSHVRAICFGVFSAVCYATRNILMKSKINNYHGSALMMYQLVIVAVILVPSYFIFDTSNMVSQFPFVLTLALLTTAVGHTLFLISLKYFSTTTASIISSTQPVYGIIIAALVLNEYPEQATLVGGAIILLSVVIESVRTYKRG